MDDVSMAKALWCAVLLAGCFGGSGDGSGGSGAGGGGTGAGTGGMGAGTGILPVAGTSPVGGTGGSGAGAGGDGVACGPCPLAGCKAGYAERVPVGECCPVCVPTDPNNACHVDCTVEQCNDGHYVIPQGECCPVCMRDQGACDVACPTVDCATPVYDPGSCCMICPDANACDGVTRCVPNADCGGVACCDDLANYFDCYCGNFSCALNLRCPDGSSYGCAPPTQGAQPPVPPPDVCGCQPKCPDGQFLIASAAGGTWPDGAQKGTFSCSTSLPP